MDDWDALKSELLNDPATREAYDARRPAYEIASKLLRLRAELGLSQRQLAARAHMTQPEIARLESGQVQPSWETIARVLAAVDARIDIKVRDATGKLLTLSVLPGQAAQRPRTARHSQSA